MDNNLKNNINDVISNEYGQYKKLNLDFNEQATKNVIKTNFEKFKEDSHREFAVKSFTNCIKDDNSLNEEQKKNRINNIIKIEQIIKNEKAFAKIGLGNCNTKTNVINMQFDPKANTKQRI